MKNHKLEYIGILYYNIHGFDQEEELLCEADDGQSSSVAEGREYALLHLKQYREFILNQIDEMIADIEKMSFKKFTEKYD